MEDEKNEFICNNVGMEHTNIWTDRKGNIKGNRSKIQMNYDKHKGYKIFTKSHFMKIFEKFDLEEVVKNMKEEAQITRLIKRINGDNMIMRSKDCRALPAQMKHIAEIIEVNETTARKLVRRWQKLGIIYIYTLECQRNKNDKKIENYYINPMYGMKTAYMNIKLYSFFREILETILTPTEIHDLDTIIGIMNDEIDTPEEIISIDDSDPIKIVTELNKPISLKEEQKLKMFIEMTCKMDYGKEPVYLRKILKNDIDQITKACMNSANGIFTAEQFIAELDDLITLK